jgi:putative chitinase
MTFDRGIYFDHVRGRLFSGALDQQQVDGQNVILGLWEGEQTGTPMSDLRWLAYVLATVYKECATKMWPITEYGSQEYLQSKEYWPYIGRGFVMLTWETNYRNASAMLGLVGDRDLVAHPEVALDSLISARILFRGMSEGFFTGRKLGEYFNDDTDDPVGAREIVNGHDCDVEIAGYHEVFLAALQEAWVDDVTDPVVPSEPVELSVPRGMRVIVNGLVVEP